MFILRDRLRATVQQPAGGSSLRSSQESAFKFLPERIQISTMGTEN